MLRELSRNILEISVSTGIVIGGLLLCSRWLNRRYAAKWRYVLWIALAVRLAIPLNPGLPVGLFHFPVPQMEESFQEQLSPGGAADPADFVQTGHMFSDFQTPSASKERDTGRLTVEARRESDMEAVFAAVGSVLPYVWLVGFLGVLGWELFAYGCFRRSLLKNSHPVDSAVEREIGTLLREMGIGKKIPAVVSEAATSPMLVGFFRRCLILPECNYADGERFFIIKHELVHYQRHDVWYKLLFFFVRSLHWFNPLVHLMVREADLDLELSCDEEVVAGEDASVRRIYTEALLSALDRQTKKKSPLTTQFYGGTKIMKRRFVNILEQTKKKKGYLLFVGILTATLALGTACGSATETDTEAKNPSSQESENAKIGEDTSGIEEASKGGGTSQTIVQAKGSSDIDRQEMVKDVLEDYFDDFLETLLESSSKDFTSEDFASINGYIAAKKLVATRESDKILLGGIKNVKLKEVVLDELTEVNDGLEAVAYVNYEYSWGSGSEEDTCSAGAFYRVTLKEAGNHFTVSDLDHFDDDEIQMAKEAINDTRTGNAEDKYQKVDAYFDTILSQSEDINQ